MKHDWNVVAEELRKMEDDGEEVGILVAFIVGVALGMLLGMVVMAI